MDWLRRDCREAARRLTRRPGYAALVIAPLAFGIGLNTIAFTFVNALLIRPAHRPDAATTGWLFVRTDAAPEGRISPNVLAALSRESRTLAAVAGERRIQVASEMDDGLGSLWGLAVSRDYFAVVAPPLVAGRLFNTADAASGVAPVVVSERFWTRRLHKTPQLSSARFTLNSRAVAVVGVVRDDFHGPGGLFEPDLWLPLDSVVPLGPGDRLAPSLTLIARPVPGIPIPQVSEEIRAIVEAQPTASNRTRVDYVRFADGHPETRGVVQTAAAVALGAVALVMLVACFNVAALVMSRASERQRELSMRAALGASRWHLARALLTDNVLLGAAAGVVGLLLAFLTEPLLSGLSIPVALPQRIHFVVDWRVLLYSLGLTTMAATLPAIVPLIHVLGAGPSPWLRTGSGSIGDRAQRQTQRLFVLVQTMAAAVFLIAALMFGQSLHASIGADLGFAVEHTAIADITPLGSSSQRRDLALVAHNAGAWLAAQPDITAVGQADRAPFYVGSYDSRPVAFNGEDCSANQCPTMLAHAVSPGYFAALDIPLRAGRFFDVGPADATGVIVDETAAAAFWPGRSPVGMRFTDVAARTERVVIGVVANNVHRSIGEPARPYFYTRLTDDESARGFTIIARGRVDARRVAGLLATALSTAVPNMPPPPVSTMAGRLALPLWPVRTGAIVLGSCASAAIALVLIGLFGVTYHAVGQRTREFGVRLAIGATGSDIRRLVIAETTRLVAPGVGVGLLLAMGLGVATRGALYGVPTIDWRVYLAAGALLFVVPLAAGWWPAQRAARVNPLEVLRAE